MRKAVFWSAGGSVGKSSLALAGAVQLASRGLRVLLVDLDFENPGLHLNLALATPPAGIAALLRLASQKRLSSEEFERLTISLPSPNGKLVLIPGLPNRTRASEINAESLTELFQFCETEFDWVVIDAAVGCFLADQNTMSSSLIEFFSHSESVVVISSTEPTAIYRLVANWPQLRLVLPEQTHLVVNRVRESVLGKSVRQQVVETFERLLNLSPALMIGEHSKEFDQAIRTGNPIDSSSKSSTVSAAVQSLVGLILDSPSELQLRVAKLG